MKAFHAVHVPVPHEFTRSLSFFVYSYPYRILKRNELVLTSFQFHVRLLSSIILYPIHVCILCHCTRGVGSRHTGFSVQPFSTLHVHCTGPGILRYINNNILNSPIAPISTLEFAYRRRSSSTNCW